MYGEISKFSPNPCFTSIRCAKRLGQWLPTGGPRSPRGQQKDIRRSMTLLWQR